MTMAWQSAHFCRPLVWLALVWIWGCGPAQPPRATVSGKVEFQGEPVPLGYIVFVPLEEENWDGFYSQGEITSGTYTIDAHGPVVGKNRVKVHGYRPRERNYQASLPNIVGREAYQPPTEQTVETPFIPGQDPYIPPKYNTRTELTVEIKPGANDGVDLILE